MNRVAKNMDSVFANCTDSELDFEVMFDDDDSLIDLVAGVNEAGELVTGPNPEDTYEYQLDEDGNDPLTDKDDEKQREGVQKNTEGSPEGSVKDADEKFESPEGMKSEIPGSANSAEATSHDDDEKDAEEKALTQESNTANPDGPLKDDDEKEREGKSAEVAAEEAEVCPDCGKPAGECKCAVKESLVAKLIAAKTVNESDNIDSSMNNNNNQQASTPDDKKLEQDLKNQEREANTNVTTGDNSSSSNIKESIIAKLTEADVESRTDDTFEAELKKEGDKEDPISDKDDEELRDGKEKYDSNQVEAIKQKIISAANEASEECGDCGITVKADQSETVADDIQTNAAANNIVPDRETQSSDGLAPATEEVDFIKEKILASVKENEMPDIDIAVDENAEKDFIKNKILENTIDNSDVIKNSIKQKILEASVEAVDSDSEAEDDADIEAIEKGGSAEGPLDLSVDYDDDELIDMAISGKI